MLGIERNAEAAAASRRAVEQGCSSWMSFENADPNNFKTADLFDALVGRCIARQRALAGAGEADEPAASRLVGVAGRSRVHESGARK